MMDMLSMAVNRLERDEKPVFAALIQPSTFKISEPSRRDVSSTVF